MKTYWDSCPSVYGLIYFRLEGRKSNIGAICLLGDRFKGYFLANGVYDGYHEDEARVAVENAFNALPDHVKGALLDES